MFELIIISILLGLSLGSFANVCIYRLPKGISIISKRSFCPNCMQQLRWFELMPVVSYLWSKGKCRHCEERISLSYPVIELLMAGITLFVVLQYGINLNALELIFFFMIMLIVARIDWKHFIIPNQMVIVGLIGGIVLKNLIGRTAYFEALIGSFIAFTILIAIRMFGNFIFKKQSMGWGDIKLAAVIGLFLGFQDFLISLWLAAIIASIYGLLLKQRRSTRNEPSIVPNVMQLGSIEHIPFGSFLAGVSCIILFLQTFIQSLIESWLILNL